MEKGATTNGQTHSRKGEFHKVGENLYRYSSNDRYYGVFRVDGTESKRKIIVLKTLPHSTHHWCEQNIQPTKRKKIMSTQSQKGYMLIFRGTDWYRGLSPEEMQQVADQWMAWFNRLKDQGKAVAGNPLEPEGKIVSGKNGRVVSDGPFAESKETIGGYFLLKVNTLDESVAIAKECPGLPYGIRVEVRPVAGECPIAEELRSEAQIAHATS